MKLLSPFKRTIVSLVGQDKPSKEIADLLALPPRTVEKHRAHIIAELGLGKETGILVGWAKYNLEFFT
jgi:DNA-binding CsgD family transcriptional regulator